MSPLIILAVTVFLLLIVRSFIRKPQRTAGNTSYRNHAHKESPAHLTAKEFAEKYQNKNGQIEGGTLCFWGHWFGKPYDNFHRIISVDFNEVDDILTIRFSEEEKLTIIHPREIEEYKERIQVNKADKVYWQWYYYGRTQEPENLFYYDITRDGSTVKGSTNVNWYKPDWNELTITKPAVLLT